MRMIWSMLLIILGVLFSVSVLAEDLFRFSGSNPNSQINSIYLFDYNTTHFAENKTVRANVTDVDGDEIIWVNFTLINPAGLNVINNTNGTRSGTLWNSTSYTLNMSGTWILNIQSSDNDTINRTTASISLNLPVADTLQQSPSTVVSVVPINSFYQYNFSFWTDTRTYLNFSISNTMDGNISINLSADYLMINSTQYSALYINLSTNASSEYGLHAGYLNITRLQPYYRTWLIPFNISVSDNYGDIEFVSPSNYVYKICPGAVTHSLSSANLGNYPMPDCISFFYLPNGTTVLTGTPYSLSAGGTGTAEITYTYSGTVEYYFMGVECTASPSGAKDRTTSDPKISFELAEGCGGSSTVTGGGGASISAPVQYELPTNISIIKAAIRCGDKICDEKGGEDPWSCATDCMPELFNFNNIFCTPAFSCGNWAKSWFINIVALIVLGGMLYFGYVSEKSGRLKSTGFKK